MSLNEHLSVLVFGDEHFVCEDCCSHHTDEELEDWTRSIMHSPHSGMPIALWIVHEQNKGKTMMSINK